MKYKYRESKQRQRESRQRCTWYLKDANTFCHSKAVRGQKFCKQHRVFMRRWVLKKHKASYSKANEINWTGWSKYDD